MKVTQLAILAAAMAALAPRPATAALYRDEMTNGAGWTKLNSPDPDSAATFNYDYSANGIPEAPHSLGGDAATRGVKLEANNGDAVDTAAFFTLVPTGKNFTGNYQLRFDAWMNWDADQTDANGTTEFLGGGIGHDSTSADAVSGAQALGTGDGGSGSDYRAFKSPPQFFIPAAAMAGGSRNNAAEPYFSFFPPVNPPAAQVQSNPGIAGTLGFQWVTWEFSVVGNTVSIVLEKPSGDRLLLTSYDKTDTSDGSAGVNTDGNISIVYADFFSSVTPRPFRTFGVVDNVLVQVPEPGAAALTCLGLAGLLVRRRK